MKLTVLYFARLRETLGREREQVEGEFTTVRALRDHLTTDGHHAALAAGNLMCARNEALCSLDEPLLDGDEVAFFPTVTGG